MTFLQGIKRGLIIGSIGLAASAFASSSDLSGCWNAQIHGLVPYVGGGNNTPQTRDTVIAGMTLDDGTISGGEAVTVIYAPNESQSGGIVTCYATLASGTYSIDSSDMMSVSATFTATPGQSPACETPQTPFTAKIAINSPKSGSGVFHDAIKANGQSQYGGTVTITKMVDATS
jgi:hypothetical protein